MQRYKLLVNSIFLSSSLSLLIVPLFNKNWLLWSFTNLSWYIMLMLFLVASFEIIRFVKDSNLITYKTLLILTGIMLLSILLTLPVEKSFRVLSDETNLLSVSRNLYLSKKTANITMAKYFYDNLIVIKSVLPKRPLSFPFVLSLLHTLFGYSPLNAFILNFMVLFSLLSVTALAIIPAAGYIGALTALLLIASQPVILINSCSGGFDLFNALLIFLNLILLIKIHTSSNPEKLQNTFIVFLLILFNTRYESPLICALFMTLFLLKNNLKITPLLLVTPLFAAPQIWQRILKMGDYQLISGKSLFSATNFYHNIQEFILALISFNNLIPVSHLSIILSFSIIFILFLKKINCSEGEKVALKNSLIIAFFYLFLIFSHFFGRLTHPTSIRFFIFPLIVFSLTPLWFVNTVCPKYKKHLLLLASGLLIISLPLAAKDQLSKTLSQGKKFRFAVKTIRKFPLRDNLIIADRPGQYCALGYAAVSRKYAEKNHERIIREINSRLYKGIIIIEDIYFSEKQNKKSFNFPLKADILDEFRTSKDRYIRISHLQI